MTKNFRMPAGKASATALLMSLLFIAASQAQLGVPTFTGKFRLTNQVHWDKTVLQPGDYTITIWSTAALIRDSGGRPVARFLSGIDEGTTSVSNALLIREKGGQLRVYAVALAGPGRVLVYDRSLAREAVVEARASQTVPVTLAKR